MAARGSDRALRQKSASVFGYDKPFTAGRSAISGFADAAATSSDPDAATEPSPDADERTRSMARKGGRKMTAGKGKVDGPINEMTPMRGKGRKRGRGRRR